jgi:ribosomal protein S12 methylthiotransferase
VVAEVRNLVAEGVREINLISQDTTYFGMDLWKEKAGPRQRVDSLRGPTLVPLLDELATIEGEFWIRLLYTHPAHWSEELIAAIARNPKVARYVDMPLQHIHDKMLEAMRRETSRAHIEELISRLRSGIPGVAIRTTLIVGFRAARGTFSCESDFSQRTRFERLGFFFYSREEGSRAAKMPGQVPARIKNRRHREAMKLQQRIASELAAAQAGKTLRVLVAQPRVARSAHDALDVDCRVILSREQPVGEFADVAVTGSYVYDLVADPIG